MEKITFFNIYEFELPLKKELVIKKNNLNKREGLLLNIGISSGLSGFGEISPLPFFHSESIDDARLQIKKLKQDSLFLKNIESLFVKPDYSDLFSDSKKTVIKDLEDGLPGSAFLNIFTGFLIKLNDLFNDLKVCPSVRTGLEMALTSLLFIRPGLDKIFKLASYSDLPVCRLMMDLKKDPEIEISEIIKNGFGSIKIKVGRASLDQEISSIKRIKELILQNQLDPISLRLDANSLWSLKEAVYFGKAIGSSLIEYIEDPLSNISEYDQFFKDTQIPVALDEKLTELADLNRINELNGKCPDYLKAIIIKPDFIGGFFKTTELINFARSNDIIPVLSNSFNSSLLISFIALFAGIMNLNEIPLGIDSLNLFSDNLLEENIKIIRGKINIFEIINNIKKINFNLLSPAGF